MTLFLQKGNFYIHTECPHGVRVTVPIRTIPINSRIRPRLEAEDHLTLTLTLIPIDENTEILRVTRALCWMAEPINSTLPGLWAHRLEVLLPGVGENRGKDNSNLVKTQVLGIESLCDPISPRPRPLLRAIVLCVAPPVG